MASVFSEEIETGIFRLCLNRAPVNAMTPEWLREVELELKRLDEDAAVRAVVVGSDLPVLSAGVDLKEAKEFSVEEQIALVKGLNDTFIQQYGMSKPVVTEANGAAIAGGFFFVLTADYVVASEKASFALAEVKVGVSFPTGPLELARHVLSAAPLRKMMLSGDFFKASQGQEMGFVDEVISGDRDAVKQAALKAARRYAKLPPKTYARIKHDMRGEVIEKIKADIAANKDGCADGWFNDETVGAMEAMIAATQKK